MSVAPAPVETAIAELRRRLGDRLSTSDSVRDLHSHDESWHAPHRPDAVVFPDSTEEVATVVQV
ncbi:MAG: FAD-binding oxidoreductase, partial [Gemmatimonas sp.]